MARQSKVVITFEDTATGVTVHMDPPDTHLVNRALESQGMDCTPAEMLAVYVRKAALEYNAAALRESSPIIIPEKLKLTL